MVVGHCTLGGKASQVQIKCNSCSRRFLHVESLAMLLNTITKIITAKVFVVIKRVYREERTVA